MAEPTNTPQIQNLADQAAEFLHSLLAWFFDPETLTQITEFANLFSGFEASFIFLIGVISQAAAGRVLVAAVGFAFVSHFLNHFGIWVDQPDWFAPVLACAIAVGFLHLTLTLLLGETGGAQAFIMLVGALLLLLFVRPLKLLRVPGASFLYRAVKKKGQPNG